MNHTSQIILNNCIYNQFFCCTAPWHGRAGCLRSQTHHISTRTTCQISNNTATIKKKLNVNATTQPGFNRTRKTTNPPITRSPRLFGPSQKERPSRDGSLHEHNNSGPQNRGTVSICTSHCKKSAAQKMSMHSVETGSRSVRKTKSSNQQKSRTYVRPPAVRMALHTKLPRLLNSTVSCTNSQDQIQASAK